MKVAIKCGYCLLGIRGNCDASRKTGCEKHVAVEILASRSEFRSLENALENPAACNLTNNIFEYVISQGHVDPCEDFKLFKALLQDVVPDEEIAGYVAYIHQAQ
jgi:hypothetical protein